MQILELSYINEFIEYLDSIFYSGYTENLFNTSPDAFEWEYYQFVATYYE